MAEKKTFLTLYQKAILCSFTGNKEMAFLEKQSLFLFPRHKFGPCLQEIYIISQSSS